MNRLALAPTPGPLTALRAKKSTALTFSLEHGDGIGKR